jgi:hypothetical protein
MLRPWRKLIRLGAVERPSINPSRRHDMPTAHLPTALRFSKLIALAVIILSAAGCASSVNRSMDPALSRAMFAQPDTKLSKISLSLSDVAQGQLPDNLKFDQNRMLETVRRALEANNLLVARNDPAAPAIDIVVTDIRVRSNFTAIMFGFMAGADQVAGDVVVRDSAGNPVQSFSVKASYALGGLGGGQDEARMSWLYETFAKHVIQELTGKAT